MGKRPPELDHEGEELIKTVEGGCAGKVVVVMHTGRSGCDGIYWASPPAQITRNIALLTMAQIDWLNISAVIWAAYPGEESGNSLVDILWGDVSRSGKVCHLIIFLLSPAERSPQLPMTMKKTEYEWPCGNIIRLPVQSRSRIHGTREIAIWVAIWLAVIPRVLSSMAFIQYA